ncbi:putative D-aminoacyl-tRNA deacylase [Helianthus annuus]|nr:putative D-aminoacyl-tRNA deacylase [Helianthus annuus]KAJ0782537.1 putative D-aminoacyl-tRNA deacylase [Helianthus annuus]KAJ0809004.1 putative D-aminoacyl-tRNA deacylase [Helianthus annuus]
MKCESCVTGSLPTQHEGGCVKSSSSERVLEMKVVVQRVASASVEVEGRTVSAIGPGLLVLVGIHDLDSHSDADYICRKVLNMRLFPNDKSGKTWDQNVMQKNYEVLLVSQFTLYGILKGNKPDFHVAMPPDKAKSLYASLVQTFQTTYRSDAVRDGVFGAMMKVNLVNDGPVTMQLESPQSSSNTKDGVEAESTMNGK